MKTHPFEQLSDSAIRFWSILLAIATASMTAILAYSIPFAHFSYIGQVEEITDAASAIAIVQGWPQEVRLSATYLIGSDYLYDILHNNTVALLCIWSARVSRRPWHEVAARFFAWVMWLDTALNLFENLAFLEIVRGTPSDPWPLLAVSISLFRTVTLCAGFFFAILVFATSWRRRRGA